MNTARTVRPSASTSSTKRHASIADIAGVGAEVAVPSVARLREKYGSGPLPLRLFGREFALVLSAHDLDTVLRTSPERFAADSLEKHAALRPFQPNGVLISRGELRAQRRDVNEYALDTERAMHRLAEPFAAVIAHEAAGLLEQARGTGSLDSPDFIRMWWRLVRRVVFGDAAQNAEDLTDALWTLRSNGNWSYFHPVRRRLRATFLERLHEMETAAPDDSLAGVLRELPTAADVDPIGQIPHWLFAFDAAGTVAARTLAALSTHPRQRADAMDGIDDVALSSANRLDYLRACVLDTTRPGRNLVLLVTSTLLGHLLHNAQFTVTSRLRPNPDEPLPATLNNFGFTFAVEDAS